MRTTSGQLASILAKGKVGISSALGKRTISSCLGGSGQVNDVEPTVGDELEGPKKLQIRCSGKVVVRIKFYRRRLADYSRAISEKALIDALYFAGAISGDSEKEIRLIDEGQWKVETNEEERTELVLEYPEVDYDNLFEESKRTDGR